MALQFLPDKLSKFVKLDSKRSVCNSFFWCLTNVLPLFVWLSISVFCVSSVCPASFLCLFSICPPLVWCLSGVHREFVGCLSGICPVFVLNLASISLTLNCCSASVCPVLTHVVHPFVQCLSLMMGNAAQKNRQLGDRKTNYEW